MAEDHYLVLARKWRPQCFADVVGQEHITRTLQNAITAGRIGHAFLFIGSRGIGKTTTARVLAKALNCLATDGPTPQPCGQCANCVSIAEGRNMDVIEIDGASNNSVADVREIRENVRLVPSNARYKIYIIDEVHQLSSGAFNALLKTLEEPPVHAVFILATTEAHRIPATIISRCQRYDFRRVGLDALCVLLRRILDTEGVACTNEALYAIARAAEGGIRDAESILDQIMSYCEGRIEFQDVVDVLGLVRAEVLYDLCEAMLDKDIGRQLKTIEDVVVNGKDLSQFVSEILGHFRNLLVCKTANPKELLALPDEDIARLVKQSGRFSLTHLIRLVEQFAELTKGFDSQLAQRIALESTLIRISKVGIELSVDTVLEKLVQLGHGGIAPGSSGGACVGGAGSPSVSAEPMGPAEVETEPDAPGRPEATAEAPTEVTAATLRIFWQKLVMRIKNEDLHLAVCLDRATPLRLDGAALVIQFREADARQRKTVEARQNLDRIERLLVEWTSNVTTLGVESAVAVPRDDEPAAPQGFPLGGHVSADRAREALKDPHVAKVVDAFKGRIVNVRGGGDESHEAE